MSRRKAKDIRKKRLAPQRKGRQQQLYLLLLCTEIEALVRWGEMQPESSAGFELTLLKWEQQQNNAQLKSFLPRVAGNEAEDRQVRASACLTLGLLKRRQRAETARREGPFGDRQEQRRSLYRELDCYDAANTLMPQATAFCYAAECLKILGRDADAAAQIRQALLLAPEQVLAKRLAATFEPMPEPSAEPGAADSSF